MPWVIYQRDDCHLCDQALDVLSQARLSVLESVFIDHNPCLEARFGMRVPVLQSPEGKELDWPFSVDQVVSFVADDASSAAPGHPAKMDWLG